LLTASSAVLLGRICWLHISSQRCCFGVWGSTLHCRRRKDSPNFGKWEFWYGVLVMLHCWGSQVSGLQNFYGKRSGAGGCTSGRGKAYTNAAQCTPLLERVKMEWIPYTRCVNRWYERSVEKPDKKQSRSKERSREAYVISSYQQLHDAEAATSVCPTLCQTIDRSTSTREPYMVNTVSLLRTEAGNETVACPRHGSPQTTQFWSILWYVRQEYLIP
jgi:hypothetical protein